MLIGKTFDILALSQRAGTKFQILVAGYLGNKASCLSITHCLCGQPGESSDVRGQAGAEAQKSNRVVRSTGWAAVGLCLHAGLGWGGKCL